MAQDVSQLSDAQLLALIGPQSAPARQPARQAQPRAAFQGNPEELVTGLVPGVRITSRQRTPERQQQLIAEWERNGRQGVRPATNSRHLTGNALDLAPPPGMSMAQLATTLRGSGLPFAELLDEGDHVHVGWDGFPQSAPAAAAPAEGVEGLSDDDLLALAQGQPTRQDSPAPIEVDINGGVVERNGRAILVDPDAGTERDLGPYTQWLSTRDQRADDRRALIERRENPQYQQEYEQALARSENVPAFLENLLQGASLGGVPLLEGALGYIDPNVEGIDRGLASQAARDASRDRQARLLREDPVGTIGTQLLGGFATPGVNAAGGWIGAGQGAGRLARAGAVGAGYGATAGLIGSEGNLTERLDDAAIGGLTGAGVGAVGQRVVDRLAPVLQQAGGGAARRLSRAGVDLTPGQMMAEVPVVGPTIRYAEDVAGGFNPLMTGVRQRQNEDVVRAAGNEALSALDGVGAQVRLPRDARTGYQVSQRLRQVLGDRYDDVTYRITARADDQLATDLADFVTRQSESLDDSSLSRLQRVLDQNVLSRFEQDGTLTGAQFKNIETVLRQQSERASRPSSTLADQDLSEAFDEARNIMRNVIARQYPEEANEIQALNRAYAVSKRVERAVSGSAAMAREGTPTPGELAQTVRQMSSDGQIAGQRGLLQGLAADSRTVLPATVGDTGSGQRAVLGGMVGGLGTGAIATVNPALAAGIAGGAIVYSRPGIAFLNQLYRLTDTQAAQELLQGFARVAQRDPALMPYYEAAAQHVLSLAQPRSPASPQAQQSPQPAIAGQ